KPGRGDDGSFPIWQFKFGFSLNDQFSDLSERHEVNAELDLRFHVKPVDVFIDLDGDLSSSNVECLAAQTAALLDLDLIVVEIVFVVAQPFKRLGLGEGKFPMDEGHLFFLQDSLKFLLHLRRDRKSTRL